MCMRSFSVTLGCELNNENGYKPGIHSSSVSTALTAAVMILHLSQSTAILLQMPTPMFLRSSSMLSSHLSGGHLTLLVPYNIANVNILQGDIH
jgi:hypothetical protein